MSGSNMAEVVSQRRITNKLTRLYAAVNELANRAVVTSDDIQYFINCLEHSLAGIQYTLSILLVHLVCTSQMKSTIEVYFIYALIKKV